MHFCNFMWYEEKLLNIDFFLRVFICVYWYINDRILVTARPILIKIRSKIWTPNVRNIINFKYIIKLFYEYKTDKWIMYYSIEYQLSGLVIIFWVFFVIDSVVVDSWLVCYIFVRTSSWLLTPINLKLWLVHKKGHIIRLHSINSSKYHLPSK